MAAAARLDDKRPMTRVLALCAGLLLVACASQAGYREIVESWIGASEADLVASVWGPPDRVYEIPGGTRILSYSKTKSTPTAMPGLTIGSSGTSVSTVIGGGMGGGERYCETNFTVEAGVIANVSFQGNDCAA